MRLPTAHELTGWHNHALLAHRFGHAGTRAERTPPPLEPVDILIIFLGDGSYPRNVLNTLKIVPETRFPRQNALIAARRRGNCSDRSGRRDGRCPVPESILDGEPS
jgi:hypothetical protein